MDKADICKRILIIHKQRRYYNLNPKFNQVNFVLMQTDALHHINSKMQILPSAWMICVLNSFCAPEQSWRHQRIVEHGIWLGRTQIFPVYSAMLHNVRIFCLILCNNIKLFWKFEKIPCWCLYNWVQNITMIKSHNFKFENQIVNDLNYSNNMVLLKLKKWWEYIH